MKIGKFNLSKKAIVAIAIVLILVILGAAAGGTSSSNSSNQTSASSQSKEELENLQVGDTAHFSSYDVTIESVDVTEDSVTAHVKVKSNGARQSLKTKYFQGETISSSSFDDGKIDVEANGEVSGTLEYSTVAFDSIKWNNWSNEATWHFNNPYMEQAKADAAVKSAEEDEIYYAMLAAHENAANFFDVPNSVDFPSIDNNKTTVDDLIIETGRVKYKNVYNTKIKNDYTLTYYRDGTIYSFILDGNVIYNEGVE